MLSGPGDGIHSGWNGLGAAGVVVFGGAGGSVGALLRSFEAYSRAPIANARTGVRATLCMFNRFFLHHDLGDLSYACHGNVILQGYLSSS